MNEGNTKRMKRSGMEFGSWLDHFTDYICQMANHRPRKSYIIFSYLELTSFTISSIIFIDIDTLIFNKLIWYTLFKMTVYYSVQDIY